MRTLIIVQRRLCCSGSPSLMPSPMVRTHKYYTKNPPVGDTVGQHSGICGGAPLSLSRPPVGSLTQGAEVVDLAGVVDVVLDEDGDDAAGLLGAPVVDLSLLHPLTVVERGDALAEAVVALAEPGAGKGERGRPLLGLGHAARPEERGVAEGLVVVDVLGGAGVGDEVADGAGGAGRGAEPGGG